MKQSLLNIMLTLFILTLLSSYSTSNKVLIEKNNLKNSASASLSNKSNSNQTPSTQGLTPLQSFAASLFSKDRGANCVQTPFVDPKSIASQFKIGSVKSDSSWIKNWGYGPVAYLIDFLDPLVQSDFLIEVNKIISDFQNITNANNDNYTDYFDIHLIAKGNPLQTDADFKNMNPKWSIDNYNVGVNSVQLDYAFSNWAWQPKQNSKDPAADFILDYDMDRDGVCDYLELIRGIIKTNSNRNDLFCYDCFDLLSNRIGAIYYYIDCQNKGYITAEEMWRKLPDLMRQETRWNIFSIRCNDNIRTNSINDFMLKNGQTIDAGVTKEEFVNGVLLALADRHLTHSTVVLDNSRSLKDLRWTNGGSIDTVANQYLTDNPPPQ